MPSELKYFSSEEFTDKIPSDLVDGVLFITKTFYAVIGDLERKPNFLIELFAAHSTLYNFLKVHDAEAGEFLEFEHNTKKVKEKVFNYFHSKHTFYDGIDKERKARETYDFINAQISSKFGKYIIYELREDQIDNIQKLINELRDRILKSESFEESHRQRILQKLEKLQKELHKKMTDYDRFFGLVVEMNLFYQNYKEAKPLFELTIKIANIVLETMTLANGLPARTLLQLP